jgi:putative sigma-54 modulation protein
MQIITQSVHFTADQKLLDYIEEKLNKLEKYYDRIVDAKVLLKLENNGQVRDKIVDLRIRVPGNLILASGTNKSFEQAFDEALATCKRQLRKYKERLMEKH